MHRSPTMNHGSDTFNCNSQSENWKSIYVSKVMPWIDLVLNTKRSGWLMLVLAQRYNEHPPILKHKSFLQVSFLAFHTSKARDILQCTFKHFAKSVAQEIQFGVNRSFTVLNQEYQSIVTCSRHAYCLASFPCIVCLSLQFLWIVAFYNSVVQQQSCVFGLVIWLPARQ